MREKLLLRDREFRNRVAPDLRRIGRRGIGVVAQTNAGLAVDQRIAVVFETRDVLHARELLRTLGVAPGYIPRPRESNRIYDGDIGLQRLRIDLADALRDARGIA